MSEEALVVTVTRHVGFGQFERLDYAVPRLAKSATVTEDGRVWVTMPDERVLRAKLTDRFQGPLLASGG